MIDPGLTDKVVLITGTNNPLGIGAAMARAFATQGARLFLHSFCQPQNVPPAITPGPSESYYRSLQATPVDQVLGEVRALGAAAFGAETDLSDPAAIPALFDQAEQLLGPVEVLVNNAASWEGDTFLPSETQLQNQWVELWTARSAAIHAGLFDHIFAVNTRAAALLMGEFADRHLRRGANWGRILNISTDGAACGPSEATYAASKLALESYTRTAAVELGRFGVTVNVLALGPVQTGWITPKLERAVLPSIPLGRMGTPDDVADVVVFLASEQARWLTGQRICVGGGHGM